jgi:hypothetical protein
MLQKGQQVMGAVLALMADPWWQAALRACHHSSCLPGVAQKLHALHSLQPSHDQQLVATVMCKQARARALPC